MEAEIPGGPSGRIMPNIKWPDYAEHQVAGLSRTSNGRIWAVNHTVTTLKTPLLKRQTRVSPTDVRSLSPMRPSLSGLLRSGRRPAALASH